MRVSERLVASADLIPDEVPGARWVALAEGDLFPAGNYRIVYRVLDETVGVWHEHDRRCYCAPYMGFRNTAFCQILVVAPLHAQAWWERHYLLRRNRRVGGL